MTVDNYLFVTMVVASILAPWVAYWLIGGDE